MGCSQSSAIVDTPEKTEASRRIDRELEKERKVKARIGQEHVLKQLRIKYSETEPYDIAEREEYRSIILSNTVQSMTVLLDAVQDFGLQLTSPESSRWSVVVYDQPHMVDSLECEAVEALAGLWAQPVIQRCLQQSGKIQLNDSDSYFFENLHRTTAPDYLPTTQDILKSRVRTTGIVETRFKIKDRFYKVIDVGGQRSERRKWISAFEGVDVLLFLFATSEIDQTLREDETQNRFIEAETLFTSISNSRWFKDSSLIIFFNKIDLFAAKLQYTQLSWHLPEYKGPNTVDHCLEYIKQRVVALYTGKNHVYSHFTCATDTKAIDVVLSAVQDQILSALLQEVVML